MSVLKVKEIARPKCKIESCNLPVEKHRINKLGISIYRSCCAKHRRKKPHIPTRRIPNSQCSLCGWTGTCDRHRLLYGQFGGRYTKGNVIIVCPNCHSSIHDGKLIVKQRETEKGKQKNETIYKNNFKRSNINVCQL